MKPFLNDTYIVLDLPNNISEYVLSIRKQYKDDFRVSLPVEITVAGSSGIGTILQEQDPDDVYSILDSIASKTPPIKATFRNVLRFPNTDIFVYTLRDESPFRVLHNHLVESGIKFQESPFPFTPHCTLSSRTPISEEEAIQLLSLQYNETFIIDTMTVLSLYRDTSGKLQVPVLHKVKLTGI